ncbi:unnamed protein product [Medioppia subpectinata]|uniref:Uncharacterized protein n=1 Tax=Medioppia subpectinata TaxID=1979941 RepID=A0A7R9KCI7_9ACAR|nr:unnamed protein product [Medioppia subpectinata]CAG2100969.1 unnamed protein product [Medioppia subpectinata]
MSKMDKTVEKECIGKAGDMSKFKKVDLTKLGLKQMLIDGCDDDYEKCRSALEKSDKKMNDDLIKVGKSADPKEFEKLTMEKNVKKECVGKVGDMSKFKKVDLTKIDLKQLLIEICDKGYKKCIEALEKSNKKLHDDITKVAQSIDPNDYQKFEKCALDVLKK